MSRVGSVLAAAAIAVGISAGTAYAGTDTSMVYVTNNGIKVGAAQFENKGDVLAVCDIKADGFAVWGGLYQKETGILLGEVYNNLTASSCLGDTINLTEGANVYVKVCLASKGDVAWATCKSSTPGKA